MFTAAPFTIARTWKQPKCPSTDEWIKKMWYIYTMEYSVQFSPSVVFDSLWPQELQASLSITNYQSLLKLMSIDSMMPANHLIFCHALLLLPSIFPSIRIFFNELVVCIRWPKYWNIQFSSVQSLSHVQLFATPWIVASQAPLTMGFFRKEYWSGLPCPPPVDLPNLGIKPRSSTLQVDFFFTIWATREAQEYWSA